MSSVPVTHPGREFDHISNWERAHRKHLGPDLLSSQIKSAKSDAHANRLCLFVGGRVAGDPLRMCRFKPARGGRILMGRGRVTVLFFIPTRRTFC